jgi:hypothetical protein
MSVGILENVFEIADRLMIVDGKGEFGIVGENKGLLLKSVYRLSVTVSATYRFWMLVSFIVLTR